MKTLMDYVIPVIQVLLAVVSIIDATCRVDQIDSCKEAAKSKKLDSFHAGGKCLAKHYVQFTHMCTVNNYLPSTDFCCCVHERKVLCCRYQQEWSKFRCTQADDTIDTISDSGWFGNKAFKTLPLEILIPVIVGPILVVICCIACIVKCCCYNYDSEDNGYCDIPCLRKCRGKNSEKLSPYQASSPISKDEEVQPLSSRHFHPSGVGSQYSTESANSETKLLPLAHSHVGTSAHPSAPPCERVSEEEGSEEASAFDTKNNFDKESSKNSAINNYHGCVCNHPSDNFRLDYETISPYQYTRSTSFTNRGVSGGGGVEQGCSSCPSCSSALPLPGCPPPAYELHSKDRVLT